MNVRSDNTGRKQPELKRGRGRPLVDDKALRDGDDKPVRGRGRPLVDDKALRDGDDKPVRGRGRPLVDDKALRDGDDKPVRGRGRPLVDDKRRRILDAALKTFAARGYHGTSVPEVAEAAGVGVGTLYRYFEDKNALVNELYRDTKQRLKDALLDGFAAPDVYQLDNAERWFSELWHRLATFARTEPDAFRFLEMQDHVEYLDAKSRALELSVLAPLWFAGKRLRDRTMQGPPVDVAIALLWGAFVGLVKASRLGYLPLDDRKLEQAGAAAWRMIAPETSRATERPASRATERPASRATERPASRATERPASRATERPASRATERPASRATERPASRATERPASRASAPSKPASSRKTRTKG